MQIITKDIVYPRWGDSFDIYNIADIHEGSLGCDHKRLAQDVELIANNKNAYFIGGGDWIDAINVDDRRFDGKTIDRQYLGQLDNIADAQAERVLSIMSKIKDRCLGLHRGNHEETIRNIYHRDIVEKMCHEWKVPNLEDTAFIVIRFIRRTPNIKATSPSHKIVIFSAHGNVAGRSGGSKVSRLESLMGQFDADVYMLAHGHKKVSHSASVLGVHRDGETRLRNKKRVGFMTGSYLRSYQRNTTSYAEKGLYPPSDLGMVGVRIRPETQDFTIINI